MIYLDHAATTPLRKEAFNVMLPYFAEHAANANALYAEGRKARSAIDQARRQIADAIHAKSSEIYFTGGGSESDNWALFGVMRALEGKNHIITTQIEHHAILNACAALESLGCDVTYVPVDQWGRVSPQDIEKAIRPETGLVSVMAANNEVGTIQPIAEIARIAHAHGVLMHTDAVQAVGHIPIDVAALNVDLLSMAAHKFYGPKGIGALYIKNGVKITNLVYGGEQERGLRAGTENTPAIVGMGEALALACSEMDGAAQQIVHLRDLLENEIMQRMPEAIVNGDREKRLPGTLHVTFPGADTNMLLMRLDMEGIAVSAGSACAAGARERSHVLEAMHVPSGADVRFSLGTDNDETQIRQTVDTLYRILNG